MPDFLTFNEATMLYTISSSNLSDVGTYNVTITGYYNGDLTESSSTWFIIYIFPTLACSTALITS